MTLEEKIKETLINLKIFTKKESFSWESDSKLVAIYCPEYFNSEKFNWDYNSYYVAEYCPQHFDSNKYDWEDQSWAVTMFCPKNLDLDKANLENIIQNLTKYKGMSLKEIKEHAILNKL